MIVFPEKCKLCEHFKKCKGITRGSKKCRERLGEERKPVQGLSSEKFSIALLWYYYNQSREIND